MAILKPLLLSALLFSVASPALAAPSPYLAPANAAAQWLESQQSADGSWGTDSALRMLDTVEAVTALRAVGRLSAAYHGGVAWLENHAGASVDFAARRALALSAHGDSLAADLAYLRGAHNVGAPATGGWGLTGAYSESPMDSAIVLLASSSLNDNGAPVTYLKNTQLTLGVGNMGWPLAQSNTSDPLTTALVLAALLNNGEPAASPTIQNAVNTLSTAVGPAAPPPVQALTAMALLKAGANATSLLSNLTALQSVSDGSINGDVYTTALALRSFAAAMGTDAALQATRVTITDPSLRAAVNAALGRNLMDAINRAELARLTALNAAGLGITNLSGLEFAVNLTALDLRNNNITSTAPLAGLPLLTSLKLSGNPVVSQGSGEIPMLPPWAMTIFAGALLLMLRRWTWQAQARSGDALHR